MPKKKKQATKKPTKAKKAKKATVQKGKNSKVSLSQSDDKALVKFDPLQRYLTEISKYKLLTREQEMHLFRKMNYLKYKASKLRESLDLAHARSGLMDHIEQLHSEAMATKNEIISANLRLVVSIAKRHVGSTENFFE